MTFLDILITVLLGVGAIVGFKRGFLKQVALFAALLLGIFLAVHFAVATASLLAHFTSWNSSVLVLVAFLCNFILAIILVFLGSYLIRALLHHLSLAWLDKLLGLVLGFCTMLLVLSTLFFVLAHLPSGNKIISPQARKESALYGPVTSVAPAVFPRLKVIAVQAWESLTGAGSKGER